MKLICTIFQVTADFIDAKIKSFSVFFSKKVLKKDDAATVATTELVTNGILSLAMFAIAMLFPALMVNVIVIGGILLVSFAIGYSIAGNVISPIVAYILLKILKKSVDKRTAPVEPEAPAGAMPAGA